MRVGVGVNVAVRVGVGVEVDARGLGGRGRGRGGPRRRPRRGGRRRVVADHQPRSRQLVAAGEATTVGAPRVGPLTPRP